MTNMEAQRYCLFITMEYIPFVKEANRWLIPYPNVDIPLMSSRYRLQEEIGGAHDDMQLIYKQMFDCVFMFEYSWEETVQKCIPKNSDLHSFKVPYNLWDGIKQRSIKLPSESYEISQYVLHGVFIAPPNP